MDSGITPNTYNQQLVTNGDNDSATALLEKQTRRRDTLKDVTFIEFMTVGVLCFVNLINYMDRFTLAAVMVCLVVVIAKKDKEKPAWAKKDIRDYSDADMERLLDQWEEDEEPLPEDELPEHLRKPPAIDLTKMDMSNPESVLQATKKGQTLMMFVTVANKPSRDRTEELTKIWQTSLWSNHIQAERFLVDDDRAIFMFKDGSQAWTAKEYLLEQEELKDVQLESQTYEGKKPNVRNAAVRDEL